MKTIKVLDQRKQAKMQRLQDPIQSNVDSLNNILIRSNKLQQYPGIYLLQNYSTRFGCPSHHQEYIKL